MAQVCLISTTIHVPHVLRRYRASDPDALFIIAGDLKTPHCEVEQLCAELGNARYIAPVEQMALGYACSPVIGFNSIQRRNLALLEAIKSGADIIVTIDDDNAPVNEAYFADLRQSFTGPAGYEVVEAARGWFNLGALGQERFFYRGFPMEFRSKPEDSAYRLAPVDSCPGRVGIVNGLIHGDPDINAIERYPAGGPVVYWYRDAARQDIYVNPRTTWTPVNSQNTAYRRDLAPLAFVLPHVGRYDDIWASYMALECLRGTDDYVLFGRPWVRQARNPHNLVRDLKAEILGMEWTLPLVEWMDGVAQGTAPLDRLASIADAMGEQEALDGLPLLPMYRFLRAWLDDLERAV